MFAAKDYVKVSSLEEAYELNQKRSNRIVGGMHWLKMSSNSYGTIIDLSGLGLDAITETGDEFIIGAMCTLRTLEMSEALNKYTDNSFFEAVHHIVGVQFRNTATIGGSIFGRYGFSDILTVFMALDSYVELYKGGIIPLSEYAARKWDRDIIVNIIIKKTGLKECFKCVRNTKTDFSVINLAVSKSSDGRYRFAVGARPHRAVIVEDNAFIVSSDEETIKGLAQSVADKTVVGSNMRGSAEYRKQLVEVLCIRAIAELNN